MNDHELVSLIETLERQAQGELGSEIITEQAKAMDYYYSRPFGTEEEGRSAVISADVFQVVEGMTPVILKPFVSSDTLVKFNPVGPEDEDAAEQESEYVNYLVTQKNNVFETLVAWVKTGLLQKNGVVKYWWEKSNRVSIERYFGLTDDEVSLLAQDARVKITEHTDNGGLHDVTLRVTDEQGGPKYAVIPPEEFLISRNATSPDPKAAEFVEHRTIKTISALREMGYDIDDDINDQATLNPRDSEQYQSRHPDSVGYALIDSPDKSMREVLFREIFLLADYDGDGVAELRKVCMVGSTILDNEETEEIPFCAWTPIPQPFRFYGSCQADEATETQLVKSALIRQTMDNIYSINNNRVYVGPGVNIDDLIDNQIGGHVRLSEGTVNDQIREAAVQPINGVTMPMIEYWDSTLENRTGWTRYNQGSDSSTLNKTATGIRLISEAGNNRIELVSRAFAEMGLKPLMIGIHGLCRRHANKVEQFRLRGKWLPIDPRNWRTRYDMTVSVGLGNSDKQLQLQSAQILLNEQKALAQVPGLVSPKNFYEAAAKLANAVGEKSAERYFSAPDEQQAPPPPPDPMQNPEIMLKVAESRRKDAELELEKQKAAAEAAYKARELDMRETQAKVENLGTFAKLESELQPEQSIQEREEKAVLNTLMQNQATLIDGFMQFMAQMSQSQAAIAEAVKPQKQVLRVAKQADGTFVGIKESVPEESSAEEQTEQEND